MPRCIKLWGVHIEKFEEIQCLQAASKHKYRYAVTRKSRTYLHRNTKNSVTLRAKWSNTFCQRRHCDFDEVDLVIQVTGHVTFVYLTRNSRLILQLSQKPKVNLEGVHGFFFIHFFQMKHTEGATTLERLLYSLTKEPPSQALI